MAKRNLTSSRIGRFQGQVGWEKTSGNPIQLEIIHSMNDQLYRVYNPRERVAGSKSDAFRVIYGAAKNNNEVVERGSTFDFFLDNATTVAIGHKDKIDPAVSKLEPVRGMYDLVSDRSSSPGGHFRIKNPSTTQPKSQKVVDFRLGEVGVDKANYRFLNSGDDAITVSVGGTDVKVEPQESRDVTVSGTQNITVTTDKGKSAKGIYELTALRTQ